MNPDFALQMRSTKAFMKICVEKGVLTPTVGVLLAQGSSAEDHAWEEMAAKYLQARYRGVTFAQIQRDFRGEEDDA